MTLIEKIILSVIVFLVIVLTLIFGTVAYLANAYM